MLTADTASTGRHDPSGRLKTRSMAAVLVLIALIGAPPRAGAQGGGVIRVSVALAGADGTLLPVPRHALLVSDEPPTATPRRIVTALDGTASIRLTPGTYTVESDQPVAFQGREYQWRQTLAVVAGQDVRLELTTANAEAGPITAASAGPAGKTSGATDAIMLWQDSVVALWTPTMPASGFVIDARGLIATSHQVVGASPSVEVQIGPTVKVSGRVLVADRENDVAVLWIDPAAIGSIKPVPLGCGEAPAAPLTNGQEVVALGMPPGRPTSVSFGTVTRVTARAMLGDLRLPRGSAGGPVFANGAVVGLTSFTAEKESAEPDEARVIRIDAVCDGVASAGAAMATTAAPDGTRLPVEPTRQMGEEFLQAEAKRRTGSLNPYQVASSGFDIAFITPVSVYAGVKGPMDFSNWTDYVSGLPSVLLVRVTPRQAEGFWTKVARGLAMTQGLALPPIKRFGPGFSRLRVLCGAAEVTPIHPFLLERRTSPTEAIYEGLYVFDPGALGPHCTTVTLEAFSDKAPGKPELATVDPKVLEQIWQDFAPYRALK
jgi:S1-C subfamily serine protease